MPDRRLTWTAALDRYARRVPGTGPPRTPPGHDFASNDLHLDDDLVCPRCLQWISVDDIVRRTAYGLVQHEACPEPPREMIATVSP